MSTSPTVHLVCKTYYKDIRETSGYVYTDGRIAACSMHSYDKLVFKVHGYHTNINYVNCMDCLKYKITEMPDDRSKF